MAIQPAVIRNNRLPAVAALVLAIVYPLFGRLLTLTQPPLQSAFGEMPGQIVHEVIVWLYAAGTLGVVLKWEGRPASDIGLGRISWKTIAFGVATALLTVILSNATAAAIYGALGQTPHANAQAAALTHGSLVLALLLAVRAGAIEELFYRGIAIEELTALTGSRPAAAILAILAFVLPHAFLFDWIQLVPITVAAVILTVLYLWRRDLWSNILAHILVDTFGLMAVTLHGGA